MATPYHRGQVALLEALEKAETEAEKTKVLDIRRALKIAVEECQFPELGVVWQDTLEPDHNGIQLCEDDDCVDPQAIGHALVQASFTGRLHCVKALHGLQAKKHSGSFLTGRFRAYAFLKAVEGNHVEVVKDLSKPIGSASFALLGYAVATKYREGHYPYVTESFEGVSIEWRKRMQTMEMMLPRAAPSFLPSGHWELQGPRGSPPGLNEAIQAVYKTYFLWRISMVAATNDNAAVFQEIMGQIVQFNKELAQADHEKGDAKKVMATRLKLNSTMYLLVEELSAVQRKDGILYSLWTYMPNGSPNAPPPLAVRQHPRAAGSHCTAQAQNGLWELQVEIPVLMMKVEAGYVEEDVNKRMKQLDPIFPQRVRVNVQLVIEVVTLPNCIQATLSIKHVRMKVEESIWEEQRIGHFPCHFSISATPETDEGGSCTMSNSSINNSYKIGTAERISAHGGLSAVTSAAAGITLRMGFGASVGKSLTSTMKTTPWRFEQIQVRNDKGGSYVWNLENMKGIDFSRLNPIRLSEGQSIWKFGRRVPINPLAELPFTSEGGINFTGTSHDDTLIWRFPKELDGKKLKWTLEGSFHCTFTSTKFWETREATFEGVIEETLKALEVKDKDKDKDKDSKKDKDKDGKKDKDKDGKKDKGKGESGDGDGEKKKKKDKKKEAEEDDDEDEVPVKKSKKKKPVAEEDDDEDEVPVKKKKEKKKAVEEDDDDEDEVPVKKSKKKKPVVESEEDEDVVPVKKSKKKKPVEEEEDDEDVVPVKKTKKKKAVEDEDEEDDTPVKKKKGKKKGVVEDDDDDDEDDVPVKKSKKKKPVEEDDDDEDDVPVKKSKKKKPVEEDDDDEDETPVKKKEKKKVVEDEDDEDDTPVKKTKKKKPVEEDDDDEDETPVKKKEKKKVVEDEDDEGDTPVKKTKKKKPVEEDEDDKDETPVQKMSAMRVTPEALPSSLSDKPKLNLRPPPGRQ